MSTRGVFIIRKNNEEKGIYIPLDAYPACAGAMVVDLVKEVDMNQAYENMVEDAELSSMSLGAFANTARNGWVSRFANEADFIKDSLYCEHGYVIDLDQDTLDYYVGFQKEPDLSNRYGTTRSETGYYPCRLAKSFALADVRSRDTDEIIDEMADTCYVGGGIEGKFSCADVLLNITDMQTSLGGCIAAVSAAMRNEEECMGILRDNLSAIERNVANIRQMLA